MLAFLNLGVSEMVVILVVAIVIFGRNLPSVAVQAAANVAKLRRSLTDLRKETGIDEEIRRAQREFESVVPRDLPRDLPRIIEQKLESAMESHERPADGPEASSPKEADPPTAPDGGDARREPATGDTEKADEAPPSP